MADFKGAMGGDHGLALQESPDPSHEGSAMVALVRGSVGVGVLDHAESWQPTSKYLGESYASPILGRSMSWAAARS
jgi:hypothetical protein